MRRFRLGWLTLGALLFFCTAYWDTATPSVVGCIVLGLMVCLSALFLKRTAPFECRIGKCAGMIFTALPAFWALISLVIPDISYSMIWPVLCVLGMIGCAGYSGFRNAKSHDTKLTVLFIAFSLAIVAIYGLQNLGHYSPDSLFNYKIAQSFGVDPGRVSLMRQYVVPTDYNISFPYLYPLLIYLADCATSLEKYAGVLINLIAMMLTGWLFLKASKRWANVVWPGAMAFFILSMNGEYLEEVFAIRSIPVSMLLSSIAIYLCITLYSNHSQQDKTQTLSTAQVLGISVALGCLAGAGAVVRFDGLALLCFLGVMLIILAKDRRIPAAFIYAVSALIFMLPWMVYSYKINGSLWISDNAGTLFLVEPAVPNRIDMGDAPTLFSAPGAWFLALIEKSGRILLSLLKCSPAAVIVAIACMLGCRRNPSKWSKQEICVVAVISIFYLLKTGMYILVGYKDIRYHVETTVIIAMLLMIVFARHDLLKLEIQDSGVQISGLPKFRRAIGTVIVLISLWTFGKSMVGFVKNPLHHAIHDGTVKPVQIRELDDALNAYGIASDKGVLMLGQGHAYNGHYFGGWTHRKVFVEPVAFTVKKLDALLKQYPEIQFIVLHRGSKFDDSMIAHLNKTYNKQALDVVDVYKVNNK